MADDLEDRGFAAAAIHGDLGQGAREQALRAFRSGKVDVLVATDVAARGLDVEGITHVVNYQAPEDAMTYVHRIGRTARAGRQGSSVTFVDWDDVPRWKLICDTLDLPFHEPVETYSTSPNLLADLDIPEGITGTLPRSARTRAGLDAEQIEDLGGRDKRPAGNSRPGSRTTGGRTRGERDARPERAERAQERGGRADRPARARTRTRTRGGAAVATDTTATAQSTPDASDGAPGQPSAGSRRRRRGSRGRGASGGSAGTSASNGSGAAPAGNGAADAG